MYLQNTTDVILLVECYLAERLVTKYNSENLLLFSFFPNSYLVTPTTNWQLGKECELNDSMLFRHAYLCFCAFNVKKRYASREAWSFHWRLITL